MGNSLLLEHVPYLNVATNEGLSVINYNSKPLQDRNGANYGFPIEKAY